MAVIVCAIFRPSKLCRKCTVPKQGPESLGGLFQTCNLKAAFCYALLSYRGIGLPGVSSMVYSQALEIRSFCRSPGQKPLVRPEGITKMPFRDFQRPWLSQFASSLGHQIVQKMYSALTGPRKLRSFIPNMQPESSILLCLAIIQRHWFAWCVFHGI